MLPSLKVVIEVNAKSATAAIEKFKGKLKSLKPVVKRVSATLKKLGGKVLKVLAVAAGAVVGAMVGMAKSTLSAAENISDMAKKSNAGIEALQGLRYAADQNGASARDMDDALTRLTRRMSLFAVDGGGPAAKAIEGLGLSITDAAGNLRQSDVVFMDIARALQNLESDATKAAYASQLFGDDAGPRLLPLLNQGADGISNFTAKARELGIILDREGVEKAAAFNAELRTMSMIFQSKLERAILDNLPAIKSFIGLMGDLVGKIGGWITKLNDLWAAFDRHIGYSANADLRAFEAFNLAAVEAQNEKDRQKRENIYSGRGSGATGLDARILAKKRQIQAERDAWNEKVRLGQAHGTYSGRGGAYEIDALEAAMRRYEDALRDAEREQENASGGGGKLAEVLTATQEAASAAADQMQSLGQSIADSIGDGFFSMIEGTKSVADAFRDMARNIIRQLYDVLVVQRLVGKVGVGGAAGTGIAGWLGKILSFSGGGYTGDGSRSGGLDGKGGRLAVVHPRETIIDHTKGGGRGGGVTVNLTQTFQGGVTASDLAGALPRLVESTKRAIVDEVQRGGAVASVMRG